MDACYLVYHQKLIFCCLTFKPQINMLHIIRTDSGNLDFVTLVKQLDADLAARDGEIDHAYYEQFNKIDKIQFVVVAYESDLPVGCGAIKAHERGAMEVKRMYVTPAKRGQGISTKILIELETWAAELSFNKCILETGKRQPEAIRFYQKNGYTPIPNYGQYAGVENSLCFEKMLIPL
jgi:GNAT superfamily N-acetyltransferase